MGQIKIDAIDAAIIDLLQQDGRMSAVDIASRVEGLTPRMARYRIKRLLQESVISITAVIHPKPLGYNVMADVLIEAEPGTILDIVHHLAALDCVTYAGASTGDRDISIQVVARSVDELYGFILNEVQKIPGVRRTRTSLLPLALKFTYNWKLPRGIVQNGK
ncbi:MAG: Lrp/AsnC family transcriptional regulator [Nitrospira sp.]|nr:Lrp/AsnC family transcriptional regulator [Nitrospira sp.]